MKDGLLVAAFRDRKGLDAHMAIATMPDACTVEELARDGWTRIGMTSRSATTSLSTIEVVS